MGVPALTINRLCGSGFQAVMNAVHEIRLGEAEVVLTGMAYTSVASEFMCGCSFLLIMGTYHLQCVMSFRARRLGEHVAGAM